MFKQMIRTFIFALFFTGMCTMFTFNTSHATVTMRQVVDNTHPLYTVNFYYNDPETVTQLWNSIPSNLKPYTTVVIVTGDHINNTTANKDWIDAKLQECQANNIRVMVQAMTGETKNSLAIPVSWFESKMQAYSVLIGFNTAEFYNSVPWFGETEGNHSQYMADLINMVANYGGYVNWTDTNIFSTNGTMLDWIQNNSNLITAMRNNKQNFMFCYKESYTDSSTDGLGLGLYLAGLAGNWEVSSDWWRWQINGNEEVFGSVHPGDNDWKQVLSYPEAMYGMDLVRVASEGGTVFNFEAGYYSTANNGRVTAAFTYLVQPLFNKVLDGSIHIPTRQEVLNKNKFAYVGKSAWSVPYISPLSGLQMNTGRYGIIPLLPTNVNASELANFENTSTTPVTETYLQSLYPLETLKSNTFASRNGSTWYWMNSSDNTDVYQSSKLIPQVNSSPSFTIGSNPHTFAVITEQPNKFLVHLNNYRVNKSSIYTGTAWSQSQVNNWIYNTYSVNPDDNTLRTTVISVNGNYNGGKPNLIISGDNGFTYSEQWDAVLNLYTLTIQHNGQVNIEIDATGKIPATATASSSYNSSFLPAKAVDGDWNTKWAPTTGNSGEWLQMNFGSAKTFNKVVLGEYINRTIGFKIQYYDGSSWVDLYTGTTIGAKSTFEFPTTTAQKVRLYVTATQLDSNGWGTQPNITEFETYRKEVAPVNLASASTATASSSYNSSFVPSRAVDGNASTKWASLTGNSGEWIQLDFGSSKTFNEVDLSEYLNRVTGYKIQYDNGSSWIDIVTGTTIGGSAMKTFSPVTAQLVRFYITATQTNSGGDQPNMTEIEVY